MSKWFLVNQLSINLTKSNFIVFCSPKFRYDLAIANIKINHISLEQVQFAKFLGIYIDEHLSWHKHTQITASKISKINGILNKLHKYLPTFVILPLYNSLILSYFTHCNCVWGNSSNTKFKSLITCQKRAVRYVAKVSPKTHSLPFFKKFNILKMMTFINFWFNSSCINIHNSLLGPFINYFTLSHNVHYYNTRHSSNYFIHFARTNILYRP